MLEYDDDDYDELYISLWDSVLEEVVENLIDYKIIMLLEFVFFFNYLLVY